MMPQNKTGPPCNLGTLSRSASDFVSYEHDSPLRALFPCARLNIKAEYVVRGSVPVSRVSVKDIVQTECSPHRVRVPAMRIGRKSLRREERYSTRHRPTALRQSNSGSIGFRRSDRGPRQSIHTAFGERKGSTLKLVADKLCASYLARLS